MNPKQRDRGRILTPDGLSRLQQAIRAWELEHEVRCTQERIKELTSAVKEGGLDPGTIRKILKAKEGVDPESIRCLFTTFGLQLAEADLVSSLRLQIQADPNFVGREGAIADLNALVNRGAKVIVIQARGGVGKTTLARKYLQQEFASFLEFPIAKETKDIASIESLIEEKLRQLGEEPGREFFVSLDRLKRKLQDERVGILIDNLEPALDSAGKFIEPHRRYVELLRVLTDPAVLSVTLITSRERLRESSVTVEHYMLRSLDIEAWEQFFQSRNLATDTSTFAALHNAYGGNAKAMDIIRGAILEDYFGDIAAYWQANQHDLFIERDLEDLVTQQFDRLQQIDSDAYNLLCRMGCYRYQDVPTVPIEGLLCLIWNAPENRQRRVVKSLQDRSLVEFENGEFWLHPVIREEAINRLRKREDWVIANYKAAEFWTKSVKVIRVIKDILQAFEAYHHYLEINDFESAGNVLLRGRMNKWKHFISLVNEFHRMGIVQPIIVSTQKIINSEVFKTNPINLAKLYRSLANTYWIFGSIKNAIDYQEKAENELDLYENSISMSVSSEDQKNKNDLILEIRKCKVQSLISAGIYRMELEEFEKAYALFNRAIDILEDTMDWRNHIENKHAWIAKILVCVSFIQAHFGNKQDANVIADNARITLLENKNESGKYNYFLQILGETYRLLGQNREALKLFDYTLSCLENSDYAQVRARSLGGKAKIYRGIETFEMALDCHIQSICLLEKIGAKYDLSQAYYQLGNTYKLTGKIEESRASFQEAIRLFIEMKLPNQVEKVKQSMLTDIDD